MRLLCLSNGHGEDQIAVRILRELQQQPNPPELYALPIVGTGHAYSGLGIPVIGSVSPMPSGGFIYMDHRQLARDIRGGLLKLTMAQYQAIQRWAKEAPHQPCGVLAVGDIVPLLFARLSGLPYAFVGTAKSEYYLRDEKGILPRRSWLDDRIERWTNCIYLPWERWLLRHPHCRAVFPRDTLTAQFLQWRQIPAFDLGNPMMDGLEWLPEKPEQKAAESILTIVLLPGSRAPEAYENWETILLAVNTLIAEMDRPLRLLAAIAPGLDLEVLHTVVKTFRWQPVGENSYQIGLGDRQATLTVATGRFAEFLHRADVAIGMTGTGVEQFVGLGKPAITLPGRGPQFTPRFAEAQTRLLGSSVTLIPDPGHAARALKLLLQNPDRLSLVAENGRRRMGEPGAARRIATCLIEQFA